MIYCLYKRKAVGPQSTFLSARITWQWLSNLLAQGCSLLLASRRPWLCTHAGMEPPRFVCDTAVISRPYAGAMQRSRDASRSAFLAILPTPRAFFIIREKKHL